MAKKKAKRGVRTYKPHGMSVFFYSLFGLAVVGAMVAYFLLPIFGLFKINSNGVASSEGAIVFTGLDFVKYGVRSFFPQFNEQRFDDFSRFFVQAESVTGINELLAMIIKFRAYVEIAIIGILALSALFAVIEFLLAFFFLIIGKSNHPKGVNNFGWLAFWFFAIAFGLTFMYFFFYQQIIDPIVEQTGDGPLKIQFSLQMLIIIGGMFVACIFLAIIHRACFKDRVALEKNRHPHQNNVTTSESEDEEEHEPDREAEITSSRPQIQLEMQKPTTNTSQKNGDVITVGDRAYAKNTELASAAIPEGIVCLGSSAFSNCVNLVSVTLPNSLQEIGFNCFFNTPKLTRIIFNGTIERWKLVKRGSNWLTKSGTKTVQCTDGKINVNPRH